jgi:transcriptional regulator with XRE-family HTH domain
MDIAEELKYRRILKGLTQGAVAKEAHINPVSLCRYEAGVWIPSEQMQKRILAAIGRLSNGKNI